MRRMIPQSYQDYLKALMKKEEFLSKITLEPGSDINACSFIIDSDGMTYCHISGSILLEAGSTETYLIVKGIPEGLKSAERYPGTNDQGTAGYVNVVIINNNANIQLNKGVAGREVYFSILLGKQSLGI